MLLLCMLFYLLLGGIFIFYLPNKLAYSKLQARFLTVAAAVFVFGDVVVGVSTLPFVYYTYPCETIYSTINCSSVVVEKTKKDYLIDYSVDIDCSCLERYLDIQEGKVEYYAERNEEDGCGLKPNRWAKPDIESFQCKVVMSVEKVIGVLEFVKYRFVNLETGDLLAERRELKVLSSPGLINMVVPHIAHNRLRNDIYLRDLGAAVINPDCALSANWPWKRELYE